MGLFVQCSLFPDGSVDMGLFFLCSLFSDGSADMGLFLAPPAERQRSFSNTDLSVVRLSVRLSIRPSVKIEGGRGLSQKCFSNFSSFLAWTFFGAT